jgi:hypothetical protein
MALLASKPIRMAPILFSSFRSTRVENKKSEGAKFIFFIGKSSPNERHYLIGTYSGFDKYDRAIAGKMILKKYNTKAEVEEEVNEKSFDPIICQELKMTEFLY